MIKKLNIPLLREIVETPGAPGYEFRIRNVIIEELKKTKFELSTDNFGNLTAYKKGTNPKKVMIAAHMDEISFIVNHIDSNGFLRFHPLGGFDPKTLSSQRVIVHGKKDLLGVMGTKPVHVMSAEERNVAPKLKDYFIDLGMDKKEVEKIVSIGDVVTRQGNLAEIGNCITGKSLDNRISVYVLIEALKMLEKTSVSIYGVFTVQEEVGLRGAMSATIKIQPDFGICLDTTIAYDTPAAPENEKVTSLGNGTGIKIVDGTAISDYRLVEFLKKTADKAKIKWQPEVLPAGGTDTARLQQMTAGGSIAGGISVPTRHIHQTIEMVNKEDVINSINLLVEALNNIDKNDWKHK